MSSGNYDNHIRLLYKDTLQFQDTEAFRYEIFTADSSMPVGYCYLVGDRPRPDETGNIGYYIAEEYRRRGYGKSTCMALLKLAGIRGLHEVYITCRKNNVASRRIIESLGGMLAGETGDGQLLWRIG